MIESIKIKLTNGKEIELTAAEARELEHELRRLFGKDECVTVDSPIVIQLPQSPDWMKPPYKITCGGSSAPMPTNADVYC